MPSTKPECPLCYGVGAYGSIATEEAERTAENGEDLDDLHEEIRRASAALYRVGHFRQAALDGYIRVIEEVKNRSGLNLDGDRLMNRAFGCTGQTPVIQFNNLANDGDRDEQTGIMYLFKGIVGLRNRKAHTSTPLDDSKRAHGYLALASLLMRLLEIGTVNPVPPLKR